MNNTEIPVFLGSRIDEPGEQQVVARLRRDLAGAGMSARIFANFIAGRGRQTRQIDIFVTTSARTMHVELKCLSSGMPVEGGVNGFWHQVRSDGTRRALDRNPLRQALDGTYAISDSVRQLRLRAGAPGGGKPFFVAVDTVVCIYPDIPPGSRITPTQHVDVVGYDSLLARLLTPGPHPSWADADWDAFSRHLGVYPEAEGSPARRRLRLAADLLGDYRARFTPSLSDELPALVPLAMDVDDGDVQAHDVPSIVRAGRAIVIVAPSGYGKTHTARHAALALAEAGHVPIWVNASDYEAGRLAELVSRAVAPFTTESPLALLTAAAEVGTSGVLVLDGLNECAPRLRGNLVGEVEALMQRVPVGLLATSQVAVELGSIAVITVTPHLPDEAQRRAILFAHGVQDDLPVGTEFVTPQELSMLAECANDLVGMVARIDLLDAFVRRLTREHAVRAALRRLAMQMTIEGRLSLSVVRALDTLEREHAADPETIDAALSSDLLRTQQGQVRFLHESIFEFLTAETIVRQADTGTMLGCQLARPQFAGLRDIALELEADEVRRRDALLGIGDDKSLAGALLGAYGEQVALMLHRDVQVVLALATQATPDAQLDWTGNSFTSRWRCARTWTREERLLLSAAGVAVWHGLFVDEVGSLLDATDQAFDREVPRVRDAGCSIPISEAVSSAYVLHGPDAAELPAAIVASACHAEEVRRFTVANRPASAAAILGNPQRARWGRLYFASMMCNATDPADAAIVSHLVRRAQRIGGYHVQLMALEAARRAAHVLDGDLRDEVVAALHDFETNNILLSSTNVEALAAYDAVEPMATVEDIAEHVGAILGHEDVPEAWVAAQSIVTNQLEDERIVGPYAEAIMDLDEPDRRRLYVMALRAPDTDIFTDWMLREIADNAAVVDERGRLVLRDAASRVDLDTPFVDHAVKAHLHGLRGWAALSDRLPEQPRPATTAEEAWQRIDSLIFDLERPTSAGASWRAGVWDELASTYPAGAIDALYLLSRACRWPDHDTPSTYARLLTCDRTRVVALLEWAVAHLEELTPGSRSVWPRERDPYVIRELGTLGTVRSCDLLRRHLANDALAPVVVKVLRELQR